MLRGEYAETKLLAEDAVDHVALKPAEKPVRNSTENIAHNSAETAE